MFEGKLMSKLRVLSCVALLARAASPAFADKPEDRGPTPGLGWGPGGSKGVAAPGPVAGVGLPAVALVGGYLWLVRRRQRDKNSAPKE